MQKQTLYPLIEFLTWKILKTVEAESLKIFKTSSSKKIILYFALTKQSHRMRSILIK